MRDRCLQGIKAVIQRQQRVLAERDNDRFLLNRQYRRMNICGAGRQVLDRRALVTALRALPSAPLRDSLLIDAVTLGENPQALLTMLYR